MMACNDELIQLYIEAELQPLEAEVVEAHLQDCAACRRRAGLYKGLFWDLAKADRLAPAPSPDDDEAAALAHRLQEEWCRTQPTAQPSRAALANLWVTANPTARAVGAAGVDALSGLGRAGLRLLFRKGGGRR